MVVGPNSVAGRRGYALGMEWQVMEKVRSCRVGLGVIVAVGCLAVLLTSASGVGLLASFRPNHDAAAGFWSRGSGDVSATEVTIVPRLSAILAAVVIALPVGASMLLWARQHPFHARISEDVAETNAKCP